MTIHIPEFALVLMVGPSGSGKSTFARKHFKATEVLSSDFLRGLVCDDEMNQSASEDAFEILHLPQTPPNVVLNETIELARRYGSADSPAFVNGVLDRIRKDAGK